MYMSLSPAFSCPALSNPINGRVTWTNLTVGGVATYLCDDAYELVGNMTRVCQGNDMWSEDEPVCRGMLITPPLFTCSHWNIVSYISNAVVSAKSPHYFSCPCSTEAVGIAHKLPHSL